MTKPSVKIKIEAEDEASAKLAEAAANVERTAAQIKATGDSAKKSTELVGTFANAFGGTAFGQAASTLAGLTDKIGAFSEVAKVGGTTSMAFKAGLVGLAGVVGFQVGNAIGNAVYETDKWTKKLDESREALKDIGDRTRELQRFRLQGLIKDMDASPIIVQMEELKRLSIEQGKIEKDNLDRIERARKSINAKLADISNEDPTSWLGGPLTFMFGFGSGLKDRLKELEEEYAKNKDAVKANLDEIEAKNRELAKLQKERDRESRAAVMDIQWAKNDAADQQIVAMMKQLQVEQALGREKQSVLIQQMEFNDQQSKTLEWFNLQIDRTRALQAIQEQSRRQMFDAGGNTVSGIVFDLQQQGLRMAEARAAAGQMVAVSLEREQELLRQQRIELEQGADALKEYLLGKQGIAKADAVALVAEQRSIALAKEKQQLELVRKEVLQGADARKVAERQLAGFTREDSVRLTAEERLLELQRSMMGGTASLQATNSRLRTRANTNDVQQDIVQNTKRMADTLEVVRQQLIENLDILSKPKPEIKLEQR